MKKTTLFLLAALCAASAFAQSSTLQDRQRLATHRRLFTELGLIDGTLAPADYTGAVAKAASAVQPADTNGWVVSSHSGLATEAQAGQIATNVASGYLPLSGYDGPVVLGTSIRGFGATTNVGSYGFAAGVGTSAGDYGFAAGLYTSADHSGFAAGDSTSAGYAGFAAGISTSAGDYGFAAGDSTSAGGAGFAAGAYTSAGEYGFAAGNGASAGYAGFAAGASAKGADGSFVFADNSTGGTIFDRTNFPNSFNLRAAGGIYAEIGTNVFAVSNAVTMNGVELGAGGGSGWTNLAFSGTGNAITNATAAGATLTLERGTIEGGTGTANETALGDPYVLTGTNVVFDSTNNWIQSWVATSAASQISFAIKTNAAQRIGAVLDITATTFPIQWLTSSPPVRVVGNVPSNAVSSWRISSPAGTTNYFVDRMR